MVNIWKSNGQADAQRKSRNKDSGKNKRYCSGYLSKTAAKVSPISHFSDRYKRTEFRRHHLRASSYRCNETREQLEYDLMVSAPFGDHALETSLAYPYW